VATGIVLLVIAVSKFTHGAWVVILMTPVSVWVFHAIKRHYVTVAGQLSLEGLSPQKWTGLASRKRQKVVVPVSGMHRGALAALRSARSLSKGVTVVIVDVDPQVTARVREKWPLWGQRVSRLIKRALIYRRGQTDKDRVIIDVPYHLRR
jgi:hypothetical protein